MTVAVGGALVGLVLLGVGAFLRDASETETPRQFFTHHRDEFDRVVAMVDGGNLRAPAGEEYYGPFLPDDLRHLSATERVSIYADGSLFIPFWTGIPDDAGGLWFSESSPRGRDMYGLVCENPTDVGAGWWLCGVSI